VPLVILTGVQLVPSVSSTRLATISCSSLQKSQPTMQAVTGGPPPSVHNDPGSAGEYVCTESVSAGNMSAVCMPQQASAPAKHFRLCTSDNCQAGLQATTEPHVRRTSKHACMCQTQPATTQIHFRTSFDGYFCCCSTETACLSCSCCSVVATILPEPEGRCAPNRNANSDLQHVLTWQGMAGLSMHTHT